VGYLKNCLGAATRLDYPRERFEVVIVNDGGGEAVEKVASRFEEQLALTIVRTAGLGAATARNAGMHRGRGSFIAFTDDDCQPEGGWLSSLERALESNPGAAIGGTIVNGGRGAWAAGSQAVLDAAHAHWNGGPAGPRFFASCNIAFPADGLRAVGGFDESFAFAEDRELCARWLRSGRRFAHAPGAIVRHHRELTPAEFWRQHFRYGRGAWAFHRTRAQRGWGRFALEPGFYSELARQVHRRRDGAGRPSVAALGAISQLANAAGFAREALIPRGRLHPANKR
jgi:cellulose synthase/poly-beta-1,6-N-acetylglucosamine synthase-like glycosyltransferase